MARKLNRIEHIALICSDYERSKRFYTEILGFKVMRETWRKERESFKLDLSLNGTYLLELFSFPSSPARPSRPEACGLRHLAFEVDDVYGWVAYLNERGVSTEEMRKDSIRGNPLVFFHDPDGLPIELVGRESMKADGV